MIRQPPGNATDMEQLDQAAALVSQGGVLIYPTETFYGLGGHPKMERVIERIYRIKGRESGKPLPLIASDLDAVRGAVSGWSDVAERLAAAFWPGPLTLLLTASSSFPPALHAGTGSVGIRISSHPMARALAKRVGGLLIATSANRSGEPACRNARKIPPELTDLVDLVLDGGELPGGLPSTIVALTPFGPELVRSGCIPFEDVLGVGRT